MEIITRYHGDVLVVELSYEGGSLIKGSMDDFISEVHSVSGSTACKVALDLSGKNYLNSNGLKDLFQAHNQLIDSGYEVFILNPSERIESLLNIAGLNSVMVILNDENELNEQGAL